MRNDSILGWVMLVAASCLSIGRADAAETTASLSWVRLPGAESCVPAQALSLAIEEHLGKSVFVSPSIAGLLIEGRIEPGELEGFTATLHATQADGQDLGVRTLQSTPREGCRSLDENLALVLALMIDPDAVARVQQAKAEPPPPPPPAPPAPPPRIIIKKERVEVPVVREAPKPEEPLEGEARIAGTLGRGILPGTAVGVLASGQLIPPGLWPIELAGYGWTEKQAEVSSGGANFSMLAASLSVCPAAQLSEAVRGHACLGLSAGALRARGFGFDHVDEGTKPVVTVVSSLRLSMDVAGPLFLSVGMGLHAAVVRPRFVVTEPNGSTEDVFQMNGVGGMGEIGLGLRFRP